jgi:hypothetical protein
MPKEEKMTVNLVCSKCGCENVKWFTMVGCDRCFDFEVTPMDRNKVIEECASIVDAILRKDEETAHIDSVMSDYATSGYRNALRTAAEAIRALKR